MNDEVFFVVALADADNDGFLEGTPVSSLVWRHDDESKGMYMPLALCWWLGHRECDGVACAVDDG
jgi:hypothetical protein